uniref:Uncharacterized protein n=1 Tax=Rhizophora mucronata TaxID=61149 RepID=A0A2P2KQ58_RHIMU
MQNFFLLYAPKRGILFEFLFVLHTPSSGISLVCCIFSFWSLFTYRDITCVVIYSQVSTYIFLVLVLVGFSSLLL